MSTLDIDDEGKEESDSHYDALMARPEMARLHCRLQSFHTINQVPDMVEQ